jgi:hypothetical protein
LKRTWREIVVKDEHGAISRVWNLDQRGCLVEKFPQHRRSFRDKGMIGIEESGKGRLVSVPGAQEVCKSSGDKVPDVAGLFEPEWYEETFEDYPGYDETKPNGFIFGDATPRTGAKGQNGS